MEKDLYICTHDYQGGDFGMYRAFTIDEWREQALDWADSDSCEELFEEIKHIPKRYIINDIENTWEIKLEKVNKDKIVKYFVENSRNNNDFEEILRKIKSILKENNIRFSKNDWENEEYFYEIDEMINYFEENDKILYEKEN